MEIETIIAFLFGSVVVLVEGLITGLGIALIIVGKKLKRYNSITDLAEFNLSKFSEKNMHYIDKRDLNIRR